MDRKLDIIASSVNMLVEKVIGEQENIEKDVWNEHSESMYSSRAKVQWTPTHKRNMLQDL